MAAKFKTTLETEDEGFFIRVPFDVKKKFGKARPPVKVSIGKYTYRSTVAVYGGEYFIPVKRAHREAAKIKAGDPISVTLELDEEERVIDPPEDLARALKKEAAVRKKWEALSYSHKREYAEFILEAKKIGTRERRVATTIERLKKT